MATRFQHLLPALNRLAASPDPVDLDQVGQDVCLSPGRVQRVFAAIVGESPKRYQARVRLQRAAALLVGTDARIVDIAIASGFESHEAFTRAFARSHGVPPSRFRTEAAERGRGFGTEAVRLASSTAPCIGLYRRGLDDTTSPPATTAVDRDRVEEYQSVMDQPAYDIDKQPIEATPILYGRRKLDRDRVADGLAEVLPAAFGHAMANGLAMTGPPFVRYVEQSPAFVTVEAGVPLAEPAPTPDASTDLEVGELPGGIAAVTVHRGPYETLAEAHLALDRWMADNGLEAGGAPWEVYLTDPAEVPDPAEWMTQVVWPLA